MVLHCIVLYFIVLYSIALYCILSYYIVSYCILSYCILLHCIVSYCILLHCIIFYRIVLHCIGFIVLYYIALHCIVLYFIVLYCTVSVHSCQYPEPPVNGERTCRESEKGVYCVLTCHPGHAFVVDPPPEYFCAYDNVWTPADQLPFPDCAGQ